MTAKAVCLDVRFLILIIIIIKHQLLIVAKGNSYIERSSNLNTPQNNNVKTAIHKSRKHQLLTD